MAEDADNLTTPVSSDKVGDAWKEFQELKKEVSRTVRFPDSTGFVAELSSAFNDKLLGIDSLGQLIGISAASDTSTGLATDLASPTVGKGSALVRFLLRVSGAVSRWVEDKLSDHVNIHDFGDVGNGGDDTGVWNLAIATLSALGGSWVIHGRPGKTYLINSTSDLTGIQMRDNIKINLEQSKLKALGGNHSNYRLVYFEGIENSGVCNGYIEGDNDNNTLTVSAPTTAAGHCLYVIAACKNLDFSNLTITKAFGDGAYFGWGSDNVNIHTSNITDNWRNNISVVAGSNVRIFNNEIARCNGTLPKAGIDVEPNPSDASSGKIIIYSNNIHHNGGDGVGFPAPNPPSLETAILASNHIHNNGGSGVRASYCKNLIIAQNFIEDNAAAGIDNTTTVVLSLLISTNIIRNNGTAGVQGFSSYAKIVNNYIFNHPYGVSWSLGENVDISSNVINTCSINGIKAHRLLMPSINSNKIANIQRDGMLITGDTASSVTKTRKGVISSNTVYSASLETMDGFNGIHLDSNAADMIVCSNVIERSPTGNHPHRAILAVDASSKVYGNLTANSVVTNNSQVEVGSTVVANFLSSPDFLNFLFVQRLYGTSSAYMFWSTADPEGAITAPKGTVCIYVNGVAGNILKVKETDTGNTGWAGK